MTTPSVRVTYTGREDPFIERNYGSSLSFAPGQTRAVPIELGAKLLRHQDVFQPAADDAPPAEKAKAAADDTAAQLAQADKANADQQAALDERQNVVDQVNLMDKDALKEFAHTKYGQPLPKTMSEANMRAKVVGLIDQYGLV